VGRPRVLGGGAAAGAARGSRARAAACGGSAWGLVAKEMEAEGGRGVLLCRAEAGAYAYGGSGDVI
jgi:hypothetical protein